MCETCRSLSLSRRKLLAGAAAAPSLAFAPALAQPRPAPSPVQPGGLPARGEVLIRNAYVLTMDPRLGDLPNGDIHVRDGAILAVGPGLSAANADVVDAPRMIALPGLIDTHWHMWGAAARNSAGDSEQTGYFPAMRAFGGAFTPEDNARGVRLGIAEALHSGLTTVHNWSHNLLGPDYADAELDAHRAFGGRALFGYGYSTKTVANETLPLEDVERVRREWLPRLDGLVTLGIASRGPENNTIEDCRREFEFARKMGARITVHMGISRATFERRRSVRALDEAGLLGSDLLIVHDTNTDRADLDRLARTNTPLSLSPFTELRTGFGVTPVQDMLSAGATLSLSVDTTMLCGNCDMFAIMKAMQNIGDAERLSEFALPARRVLRMATIDGAKALGLDDRVGSLTPGKRADIILVRTRDLNMAPMAEPARMIVQSAQPANVDMVMVDGRVLKRDGRLVAVDVEKLVDDVNDTMDRVRADLARRTRTSPAPPQAATPTK